MEKGLCLAEFQENVKTFVPTDVIIDGFESRHRSYEKDKTIFWRKYNKAKAKIYPDTLFGVPIGETMCYFVEVELPDGRRTSINTKNLFLVE